MADSSEEVDADFILDLITYKHETDIIAAQLAKDKVKLRELLAELKRAENILKSTFALLQARLSRAIATNKSFKLEPDVNGVVKIETDEEVAARAARLQKYEAQLEEVTAAGEAYENAKTEAEVAAACTRLMEFQ